MAAEFSTQNVYVEQIYSVLLRVGNIYSNRILNIKLSIYTLEVHLQLSHALQKRMGCQSSSIVIQPRTAMG